MTTTICAWCGARMAGAPPAPGERVSHGICLPCVRKVDGDDAREIDAAAFAKGEAALRRDIANPDAGEPGAAMKDGYRLGTFLCYVGIAACIAAFALVYLWLAQNTDLAPFNELPR